MLYIIKNKPYIKVGNYYKEVSVEKKGKEFDVKPFGGVETRIVRPNPNEVISISLEKFYENKKNFKDKNNELDLDDLK